jgi:type II restriction/modification system DNA methylase subunit YeeA
MLANRNVLKAYAPQARKDFIRAMTDRAALFGVTKKGFTQGEERGDLFLIEGKAFPKVVAEQRKRLLARIEETSFDQVMEAVAYTWFNRFLAIRYMELHGYFDHGYRVLSHPGGEREPEILQQAQHLNLPGLDPKVVVELKLEGDKDEVLFRRILIAQCNGLHKAIPFLFERIDDETELLLPENLLQSDSIVRTLVNSIAESEWDEIEIIGWLYQFYISEKKDQVIGKVVKSEDIPAATQLFTPNWIVKYMVQNSLGAQWLATYPASPLKAAMAYYIEPAEQTPGVQTQLDAITPKTLDPEAITLIDPAVGSGHILVEAYDLFRAIYVERGYTPQAAARAILTKNLYGLDIDDRAAQMAGFALLMKARADDRTLLSDPPALNVMSLTDSGDWDAAAIADALMPLGRVELVPPTDLLPETIAQPTLSVSAEERGAREAITAIVALFSGAKTFGSLITVPEAVIASLPALEALLAGPVSDDLLQRDAHMEARERLAALVRQAKGLGQHYDCVVANPPYMGTAGMNSALKRLAKTRYPKSKSDLLAMFVERELAQSKPDGRVAMVTIQNWLFTSSFEDMRKDVLVSSFFDSLVRIGYNSFPEMNSKVVQAATFVIRNTSSAANGMFFDLNQYSQSHDKKLAFEEQLDSGGGFTSSYNKFSQIPGAPVVYWATDTFLDCFHRFPSTGEKVMLKAGLSTGDNTLFQRQWHEVSIDNTSFETISRAETLSNGIKWYPCHSGGEFRKWYGNHSVVVDWISDGRSIRSFGQDAGKIRSAVRNDDFYFRTGITWTKISSGKFSARYRPAGFLFDDTGRCGFTSNRSDDLKAMSLLCSSPGGSFLEALCPTLSFTSGEIAKVPYAESRDEPIEQIVAIARADWDACEISWDFSTFPLLRNASEQSLGVAYAAARFGWSQVSLETQRLEEANNGLLIKAFGLGDELTPNVPLNEITLTSNPHYRYGGDLTDAEREARLLSDTMRELVSYGIGLMMGRYSLSEPGLIYAHAGNKGFEPSRYGPFPADDDGIAPITEEPWFADDAETRIEQFLAIAWPQAAIHETLATLTDGLTQGKGGEPRAALRAYLAKNFYKDHLQTYRNRPIYWLFSSGKLKAFECLVYLHRYNESTLARMRTAYVTPLMGKMQQRIADLEVEIATSSSSAEKTRKARQRENLVRQLAELRTFDEELRHLADQRIKLNLDDGVKVNYGRFGNLLAAKDKVRGKDEKED